MHLPINMYAQICKVGDIVKKMLTLQIPLLIKTWEFLLYLMVMVVLNVLNFVKSFLSHN